MFLNTDQLLPATKKQNQWLWFVGLYFLSLVTLGSVHVLIRVLVHILGH